MDLNFLPDVGKLTRQLHELDKAGVRYGLREGWIRQSLNATVNEPWPIRRAKAFAYILDHTEPVIYDGEVIMGSIMGLFPQQEHQPPYARLYEEAKSFVVKQLPLKHDKYREHALTQHDFDYFSARVDYETLKTISEQLHAELNTQQQEGLEFEDVFSALQYFFMGEKQVWEQFADALSGNGIPAGQADADPVWTFAHHIAVDYERVLKNGFGGLLAEVQEHLAAAEGEKAQFYQAVIISIKSAIRFIRKYAAAARRAAGQATTKHRKRELEIITGIIERIADRPAATFHEALQLFWFIHIILCLAGGIALAAGRFDQFMYPYYATDIKKSTLQPNVACNLLCHLWIKFNEPKIGAVQNVTIGGLKTDGTDGENDLTHLCMDAARTVALPHPNLSLRISAASPPSIYNKAVQVMKSGIGLPAMFNDEVLIGSLVRAGIGLEDARDYCVMGCMEVVIPKKQPPYDDWCLIALPAAIHTAMARQDVNGDFENFFELYKTELKRIINTDIARTKKNYQTLHRVGSDPFGSALVEGCLERGRDMYQSGTPYNAICGIWGLGLATAADALFAIKQLVYDRRKISLVALLDILRQDYRGREVLRQELINHVPKYGNDIDDVDNLATAIADAFCTHILEINRQSEREFYFPLLGSYIYHVNAGMTTATPDGRHERHPLSDGLSPVQGRDHCGPSAVINSVTKINHALIPGGVGMNIKFHPDLFEGPGGDDNLRVLIETYFKKGGEQIAVNVIGKQTLEAAVANPEHYQGLVIRVAGFNEFFTKLDPKVQQEIIERTEHRL